MKVPKTRWILLVLWMVLILVLNSVPGSDLPSAGSKTSDYIVRQGGHLLLHAMLAILAWKAAAVFFSHSTTLLWTVVLVVPYSILDELYQKIIPGRNCNGQDMLFNLVGAIVVLAWLYRRHVKGV